MVMEVHEKLFCAPKMYFFEFVHPQFGGIGCGYAHSSTVCSASNCWAFFDNSTVHALGGGIQTWIIAGEGMLSSSATPTHLKPWDHVERSRCCFNKITALSNEQTVYMFLA